MQFSPGKCQILSVGGGLQTQYTLGGVNLPQAPTSGIKDLGILMTPTLSFSRHAESVANKAKAASHIINRCFYAGSPDKLAQIYKVFIRPLTEYATPVWNSIGSTDSAIIESVQKKYTRKIYQRCRLKIGKIR
jgi:hypothetical protein